MPKIEDLIQKQFDEYVKTHKTVNLDTVQIYHIPKDEFERKLKEIFSLKIRIDNCNFPNCDCGSEDYIMNCKVGNNYD